MASEESRLGGSNTNAKLGRQLFTQLALSEIHAKKYWVEIETVEQTPDTKVHHIDQSRGHNVVQTQSVEVVDWEQHVEDPMALIRAKSRKSYPDHFCLLITARSGK